MHEKYKNKYRIQSHRLPGWDYSGNGYYFLTIVTQNRECKLGEICRRENGTIDMELSDFGKIVNNEWKKSFEIRNELYLDEFIIMPNHLHAIVVLEKPDSGDCNDPTGLGDLGDPHDPHVVETHGRASLQSGRASLQLPSSPQLFRKSQSISSFVGGFKSAVNAKIDDYIDDNELDLPKYNRNNHFFQSNYHDHIIRNENEYYRIKNYIINNPLNWKDDKFNPSNSDPEQ
ncbi:MAG: hypothetical protein P8X42_14355 [Calditrichaceae bacterium]